MRCSSCTRRLAGHDAFDRLELTRIIDSKWLRAKLHAVKRELVASVVVPEAPTDGFSVALEFGAAFGIAGALSALVFLRDPAPGRAMETVPGVEAGEPDAIAA